MNIRKATSASAAVSLLLLVLTWSIAWAQQPDPLPSWVEGPTKSAIVHFVHDVTTEGGPRYVPAEERIATFDNDGTLWSEQPLVQIVFAMRRIKEMAPAHPEWKEQQPYKAVLEGDEQYLVKDLLKGGHELLKVIMTSHSNISTKEFDEHVRRFFETVKHPKFGQSFTKTAYAPMLELLDYLRANGFKTYICSGGGIDFIRVISEETYGIVPENVIGSNARNTFEKVDGQWQIVKGAKDLFVNDKEGKPVGIDLHIGRVPILAAGNVRSGGDIAMLTYSQTNDNPSLQLLINHDDAEREFAYSEEDNASLNAAKQNGWHVVSMKSDWRRIFRFERTK